MTRTELASGELEGRAFAPAHWTAIFSPESSARDPRGRGSLGAGVVLEAGVHAVARWRPEARTSLRLTSDSKEPLPISLEAAGRLLARRGGELRIHLVHALPIGQGFGTSAAGALATSLATSAALKLSPERAITVAHLAELFGGGGLGGVAAILAGGWELRTRPGIPPLGMIRHRPFRLSLILSVTGPPLSSPSLLGSPKFLEHVQKVARLGLTRLRRNPTPAQLMEEAEAFTDRMRLAPPSLLRLIRAIRSDGAWTAQTMFGRGLVAVPQHAKGRQAVLARLERMHLPAVELDAAERGAEVV